MKIIAIGRNYAPHAAELNNPLPEKPVFFLKPDSALMRPNQPFYYPEFSSEIHYEVELVLHINRLGKHISKQFAHRYFDKIGLGIDFTARDLQRGAKKQGLPWEIAKAFDNSALLSKTCIPVEEISDMYQLDFGLKKNGEIVQHGNSKDLIFRFDTLIAYVSQFMTLKTGDLIFTGTPAGVGPVARGDKYTGWLGKQEVLYFDVK